MIAERLSDVDLASAARALQADEVAFRPKVVGVAAVAGLIELLCYLGEASWVTMALIALAAAGVIAVLRRNAQRFTIAVSGIGLSAEEKVALRKELLRDPAVRKRIDAAAHGESVALAKNLARGARRAS
jgi:hypothetical protein